MAELRNINWKRLTKDLLSKDSLYPLLKSRSLQWYLTIVLRKNGYVVLDDLDGLVLEYRGVKFSPDLINYPRMFEVWDRYYVNRIQKEDIVVDLGANIGSYTLPAAQRCRHIFSLEPLFTETLRRNVLLNNLSNVTIVPFSLYTENVDCQEFKEKCKVIDFGKLLEIVGQKVDVLRLDIGGAEWNIFPEIFFPDTRVFEIEFHFWNKNPKLHSWEYWKRRFEDEGYGYLARWSRHRHWLYVSAEKDWNIRKEVQLKDGSFKGESLKLWKVQ